MTFSIVARSADGQSLGVAVASKFLAVGSVVPAVATGAGAVASQALANVSYKPEGLALLAEGLPAGEVMERLLAADPEAAHRQVGLVDGQGRAASHTGERCHDWAGGWTGEGVAVQGNILTGPEVVAAMRAGWQDAAAEPRLARRLLAALAAGDAAGGDRRGRQSAALLVLRPGAGYGGGDDVDVDLRSDDHPDPVAELARLLDLSDLYLTASTEAERVAVDAALAEELGERVQALGHPDLTAWVGTENLEMRVADDGSWIDRAVLARLRAEGPGSGVGEPGTGR